MLNFQEYTFFEMKISKLINYFTETCDEVAKVLGYLKHCKDFFSFIFGSISLHRSLVCQLKEALRGSHAENFD
jgi:hypothetical protein